MDHIETRRGLKLFWEYCIFEKFLSGKDFATCSGTQLSMQHNVSDGNKLFLGR